MSNKAAPHRKFVQTFVLAEQPTGYYVLNDIFRYILEDEDEELENGIVGNESAPSVAPETVPATLTSSADPVQQQQDVAQVDHKLVQDVLQKPSSERTPTAMAPLNGHASPETPPVVHAEDAPAAAVTQAPAQAPEQTAESAATEATVQSEKPRDPNPTPIASPSKPTEVAATLSQSPTAPLKPAAPQTWAERLAASKGTTTAAATNGAKAAPPVTPAPLKAKTANSSTKESVTPPTSTGEDTNAKPQSNGTSGWQMAGSDNKQRQGRQHSQSVSSNQGNVLGYVKNVTEKVDASILKEILQSFGRLEYFDVSRQKVRGSYQEV